MTRRPQSPSFPLLWIAICGLGIFALLRVALAPTGWEHAAETIRAEAGPALVVITPGSETRQLDHFRGMMAVAADGFHPREIRPWSTLWVVSSGPIPPGVEATLRPFEAGETTTRDGIAWQRWTRKEVAR